MDRLLSSPKKRWLPRVMAAAALVTTLAGGSVGAVQAQQAGVSSISGSVTFWNAYNTVGPENSTLITKVLPLFH
jgi:hypothetical protein